MEKLESPLKRMRLLRGLSQQESGSDSPLMRLRLLRRITQQELADALGVSRQTISRWEAGQTNPRLTLAKWKKLVKLLDVSLEDLPDRFGPQPIHNTSPFFQPRTGEASS
jgi:putative transcriptional regulator